MDWRVKSAGSRGEHVSWVAGRAHSLYFPSTSSSENLAFHGDKLGAKDHCRVIHCTTGWIKARNPTKFLSFRFSKKAKYRIPRCWLENDPQPSLLRMKFLFFYVNFLSPSYSSVPAVHLITTVYTTVVRTRECVCGVHVRVSVLLCWEWDLWFLISYLTLYYNYVQSFRLILSVCLSLSL